MTIKPIKSMLPLASALATLALLVGATGSAQAVVPVKDVIASHVGWNVNKTKIDEGASQVERDVCTVASKDECVAATESGEAGGLRFPQGVGVGAYVYVADAGNQRVEKLKADGEFVLMIGKEVNETKDKTSGATAAEKNVCTAASKDICKAGEEGQEVDAFSGLTAVAVDPTTEDIYVADTSNQRIQKFTPAGEFVLMLGREVNETNDNKAGASTEEKNLCTATSKDTCKAGNAAEGTGEPAAFLYPSALTVGGSEELLYVGDIQSIQEFEVGGKFKRALPVGTHVIAVEKGTSDLYIREGGNTIRKLKPNGEEIASLVLNPKNPSAGGVSVTAIALDSLDRLAVAALEYGLPDGSISYGALYDAQSLHKLSGFAIPSRESGAVGMAFDANDELFTTAEQEVVAYGKPVTVAELVTGASGCKPGVDHGTSATFACTFTGEVNPEGVAETKAWFQWGLTSAFGSETAPQPVTEVEPGKPVVLEATVTEARPNATYYDQEVGEDQNAHAPELLSGETASVATLSVPPRIVEASAPFVGSSSVVLFGELNPENMNTKYFFEYGPCAKLAGCATITTTPTLESAAYGQIGATQEVTGLQPETIYSYRLHATNEANEPAVGKAGEQQLPEGTFTTGQPTVLQAQTEAPSGIAATTAMIAGSVDPDGEPATYAFELGIYAGAATNYGVIFSGPAGTGSTFVAETLDLSGLQPGTTYAYRIKAESGYGQSYGQPVAFTTAGVPSVLTVPTPLPMLTIPPVAFPRESKVSKVIARCKTGYRRDKDKKCIKVAKHKKKARKRKVT